MEPQVTAAWTVSIQGRWNLGALAVNQPGFCSRVRNRLPPHRVGFGRSFGVKLWGYGLLKAACRSFWLAVSGSKGS
jgi:hypothetical protein